MSLPLDQVRALFPHTQNQIYLNHAAISPFSTPVVAELEKYIHRRHLDEIEMYQVLLPLIAELRELLGLLIHASAAEIAFVPNTSFGLNLLTTGLDWQPGDRILLNTLEFPANVYPFLHCQRLGVEVDFVKPRANALIEPDDIVAALTPRTRLLSISYVQFLTGQRHDLVTLGRICREKGIIFCVDAIQGLGASSLDVQAMNIDFLAAGGHKWLMGAQGQGFVYVRPELMKRLTPAMVGWLSVENAWEMLDYDLTLRADAARFETGTFNALGMTALYAALKVFARWPMTEITAHILDLSGYLIEGLRALDFKVLTPSDSAQRLGIVTCEHPDAEKLHAGLEALRIRASFREGRYLRFSPHFYNTRPELGKLLTELKQLLDRPRARFGMW